MNTDPPGDLISNAESHSADILRQSVRILTHHAVHFHSIGVIYFHSQGIADTILLQIDQGLSEVFFFFHLNSNLLGFPFADSFYFRQPFRLLFYDPESIISEFFHDSGSQCFAHTPDRSGSEIAFHAGAIGGCHSLIGLYLELSAVDRMLYVFSLRRNIFSLS